jgi:DNA-binding transcriptional regulator YiaG
MSDIASALKAEITRLARKELRSQLEPLKESAAKSRAHIAALREEINSLKSQIRALTKQTRHVVGTAVAEDKKPSRQRFTAQGFATMRRKLGLSYVDMGVLLEASDQSVKNWEEGTATPRDKHQHAIFALRGVGKRDAAQRLAALRAPKS